MEPSTPAWLASQATPRPGGNPVIAQDFAEKGGVSPGEDSARAEQHNRDVALGTGLVLVVLGPLMQPVIFRAISGGSARHRRDSCEQGIESLGHRRVRENGVRVQGGGSQPIIAVCRPAVTWCLGPNDLA